MKEACCSIWKAHEKTGKPDPKEWRPPMVLLVGLGMGRGRSELQGCHAGSSMPRFLRGKRHLDPFPEFTGEKIPLESPSKSPSKA